MLEFYSHSIMLSSFLFCTWKINFEHKNEYVLFILIILNIILYLDCS